MPIPHFKLLTLLAALGMPMLVHAVDATKSPAPHNNPLVPSSAPGKAPITSMDPGRIGTMTGITLDQTSVVVGGQLTGKLQGTGTCQVAISNDGMTGGPAAITIPNSPADGMLTFPIPFSMTMTGVVGTYHINGFGPTGSGWKGCNGTASTTVKVVPPGTMTSITLDQQTVVAGGMLTGKLQGNGTCDVAVSNDGMAGGPAAITMPNSPSDALLAFPIPFSMAMTTVPGTYHINGFGPTGSGWKGCGGNASTTVTVVPPGTITGITLNQTTVVAGGVLTGKLLGSGTCDVAISNDGMAAGPAAITMPNSPGDPLLAFPIPFSMAMTTVPGTYHVNGFGPTGSGWKGCGGNASATVTVVARPTSNGGAPVPKVPTGPANLPK